MGAILDRPDLALLVLARLSAALFSLPALSGGTRVRAFRLTLTVFLVYLVAPGLIAGIEQPVMDVGAYVIAILREVLCGLFIGFATQVAFESARFAGSLIARDMGMGIAEIADPTTGVRSGAMGFLFELLAMLLFFQWNGHHWFLIGLAESFERLPLAQATFGEAPVQFLIQLLGDLFRGGMVLAGPVLVVLTLISLSMALIARAVPQMNILEAGFAWRIGGALLSLAVFFPVVGHNMVGALDHVRESFFHALETL